jgi:Mn2+/Fe2+ NRAMP family transporter
VDIEGADQAAQALRPLAGDLAFTLFALGIVGTGLLAVPVLGGSAAFAVAELLGWPHSLDKRFWQAGRFFALLGGFFLGGLVVPFLGLNVIDALVLSATINGVVAVPILFFMLRLGMDRQVMGSVSVPRTVRWLVAATILVLTGCVVAMVWTSLA